MHWQDVVLTIGQVIFIVALFPSILSKDKPALQTSLLTAAVALSIAVVYVTLSIPFAAISAALNGALWCVLAVQKWRTMSKWDTIPWQGDVWRNTGRGAGHDLWCGRGCPKPVNNKRGSPLQLFLVEYDLKTPDESIRHEVWARNKVREEVKALKLKKDDSIEAEFWWVWLIVRLASGFMHSATWSRGTLLRGKMGSTYTYGKISLVLLLLEKFSVYLIKKRMIR